MTNHAPSSAALCNSTASKRFFFLQGWYPTWNTSAFNPPLEFQYKISSQGSFFPSLKLAGLIKWYDFSYHTKFSMKSLQLCLLNDKTIVNFYFETGDNPATSVNCDPERPYQFPSSEGHELRRPHTTYERQARTSLRSPSHLKPPRTAPGRLAQR